MDELDLDLEIALDCLQDHLGNDQVEVLDVTPNPPRATGPGWAAAGAGGP